MSSECIQDDDLLVWVRLPGLDDLMTMDALRAPIRDPSPVRLLDYAMTPFALCLAGDPTEHWAELLLDDPVLPYVPGDQRPLYARCPNVDCRSRAGKRHRASAAEDDVSSIATIAKDPLVAITQPRPAKRARCCQASDPAPRCEAPVPQRPHQPAPDVERQGQPASTGCHIPVAGSLVKDPVAAAAARVPKHARYNTRVACVHCRSVIVPLLDGGRSLTNGWQTANTSCGAIAIGPASGA
ncbi:Uncharacterized protein PBTT_05745 [Plasmodiophora brassicae]